MIRVLVVDDHEIVREGLKSIISQAGDIAVTGEASDGSAALESVLTNEYDVDILDISLPDVNGFDVLTGIKKQKPDLPVLMLSIHPEKRYAIRALRAGASGYMTKESARTELIEAIRQASSGGKWGTSSLGP